MPRDHIIPRFILKGFSVNPSANIVNQKVMIFDKATRTIKTEKISDAYTIRDFNSEKTEKFLAHEYESRVAKIFQKITKSVEDGNNSIFLNNSEYRLLFRFFIIMWRRNNIQVDRAKQMGLELQKVMEVILGKDLGSALKPEFQNRPFEEVYNEMFEKMKDELGKNFYDKVIPETNDDDPTVQKTIKNYVPFIVHNKSNIHFLLHNSYATLRYMLPQGYDIRNISGYDEPSIIIEPISNTLCFCLILCEKEIDITKENFEIPINVYTDDEDIKRDFIDGYITSVAKSFIVDSTNIDLVKKSSKVNDSEDND